MGHIVNYAYHTFMEIYTNAFNQACPVEEEEEEYFYLTLNKHYTNTGHHGNP